MPHVAPSSLGPQFIFNSGVIVSDTSSIQFLQANTNRVTLSFSRVGIGAMWVSNISSTVDANQIFYLAQQEPFVITFRDFGPMLGLPWFARATVNPGQLLWTEIIYRPKE